MDGMGMNRQQPYAHWISWLLACLGAQRHVSTLESSKTCFKFYRPSMPNDARRRARGIRRAHVELEERAIAQAARDEAEREDEILAAAEAPLPHYLPQTRRTPTRMRTTPLLSPLSEFVVLMMMRQVVPLFQGSVSQSRQFPQ